MSKDIKDIINTVEKKTRSQAELEQIISSLKEEINRLKSTEKEQSLLIENLSSQMKDEQIERFELPSEIDILKDIVTSQRYELNEKQNIIERLNERIDNLTVNIENTGELSVVELNNQELLDAQMQVVQLSDENQDYRNQINSLQNQLKELRLTKIEVEEPIEEEDEEPEINEELVNIKRLNFHLMEENGLLRVELESLKAKFQERLSEAISLELDSAKEKSSILTAKIDSLKTRLVELNETKTDELESAKEMNRSLSSEIEALKSKLAEHSETNSDELESLEARNLLLSSEIESLKSKLAERSKTSSEELEFVKKTNILLSSEIELLKSKLTEDNRTRTEELESVNEMNEILSSEIELLKSKLTERNETGSEELKIANDKISVLSAELEDFEAQIKYLETQLKDSNEPVIVSTEEALEFAELREKYDNLKNEISKYKEENQKLTKMIEQLSEKEVLIQKKHIQEPKILDSIPKRVGVSLFSRMYYLFDDDNRKAVINLLLEDLKSNNSEIKRNAIKILSHIHYKKVYDALFEMITDKDWIVRYNIIKALSKFEKKNEEFTSLLKKLIKDDDVDVRELAFKLLNEISEAKIL